MDRDESLLQPISLHILYGSGLYRIEEESIKQSVPMAADQKASDHLPAREYLVISVDEIPAASPQLSLLQNILQACQIGPEKVHYLSGYKGGQGYQGLRQQFGSSFIMLFGTGPASVNLPVIFPEYQVQVFHGASYIWAPSLSELSGNKAAKAQLWQSLKKALSI